jgi:hypothetical protein
MCAFSNLPLSDCTAAASLRGDSGADHRVSVDKHLVDESIRERVCGGMGGPPQAGKTCIFKAVDYSQFEAAFPTACADRFNEMPLFEVVDRTEHALTTGAKAVLADKYKYARPRSWQSLAASTYPCC